MRSSHLHIRPAARTGVLLAFAGSATRWRSKFFLARSRSPRHKGKTRSRVSSAPAPLTERLLSKARDGSERGSGDSASAGSYRPKLKGRRRRNRSGSNESCASSGSSQVFGHARLSERAETQHLAERKPGELTDRALAKMRSHLVSKGRKLADTAPCMLTYFTSVYLPSCQGRLGVRSEKEMRTLAVAIDHLLSVDLGAATDVLIQQYKSVEQLHSDGGTWRTSRHASVVGDGRVSIMDDAEREGLRAVEQRHAGSVCEQPAEHHTPVEVAKSLQKSSGPTRS